jgi:hypothetical protein
MIRSHEILIYEEQDSFGLTIKPALEPYVVRLLEQNASLGAFLSGFDTLNSVDGWSVPVDSISSQAVARRRVENTAHELMRVLESCGIGVQLDHEVRGDSVEVDIDL